MKNLKSLSNRVKNSTRSLKVFLMACSIFTLSLFISPLGFAIDISNWSDFNNYYPSVFAETLNITDDITFLDVLARNPYLTSLTIRGWDGSAAIQRVLDGNHINSADSTLTSTATFRFINKEITFENITFKNSLNVIDNDSISQNVYSYGGTIFASHSTITFNGENVNFSSNTAYAHTAIGYQEYFGYSYGGAIYASYSSITFNSENVDFSSNMASAYNSAGYYKISYGGAIYANYSSITFNNGNVNFSSNTAYAVGGGGSSGGAIYASRSSITFNSGNVNFSSNAAYDSSGGSG
jgi:hypothetical protein